MIMIKHNHNEKIDRQDTARLYYFSPISNIKTGFLDINPHHHHHHHHYYYLRNHHCHYHQHHHHHNHMILIIITAAVSTLDYAR